MTGVLDYVSGNSLLHRLNPLTKLILAFTLCASCFVTTQHLLILGIITLNLGLAAIAGIIRRSITFLVSLLKFSLILFTIQVFFVPQGTVLLRLPLALTVTDRGIGFSLLFVLRFLAATMPLTLMLSVTQMSDMANVLTRYLHIPYKYTFVLTTAMRFIPLFSAEMTGIIEAQIARGIEFDTRNFVKKIRLLLPLCVPLLVSSVRKIEGGAISAELRGFNLRTRTSAYKQYGFILGDWGVLLVCVLLIIAAGLYR